MFSRNCTAKLQHYFDVTKYFLYYFADFLIVRRLDKICGNAVFRCGNLESGCGNPKNGCGNKKDPQVEIHLGDMWKYQEKYLVFAGYLLHSCKFYVQSDFFQLFIDVLDVVGVELWYKRAFC